MTEQNDATRIDLTQTPPNDVAGLVASWLSWSGGECPVDPAALVQVRMRDGATEKVRPARYWKRTDDDRDYWVHEPLDCHNDIVAYRVVSENPVQQVHPRTAAPSNSADNSELEPDDRQEQGSRGADRQGSAGGEVGGRPSFLSGGMQRGERDVRGAECRSDLSDEAGVSETPAPLAQEGELRAFVEGWNQACISIAPGSGFHPEDRAQAWREFAALQSQSTPGADLERAAQIADAEALAADKRVDDKPTDSNWREDAAARDAAERIAEGIRALATPAPVAGNALDAGSAIHDIAAERRRQIETEGWTPEHDDEHAGGEMALAAACYSAASTKTKDNIIVRSPWWDIWPWELARWKPKDARRDLVRAGALIVAEIERLDRAALQSHGQSAGKPVGEPLDASREGREG